MCQSAEEIQSIEQRERFLLGRIEALRKTGNRIALAKACNALGILYRDTGRYEDSIQVFQNAGEAISQKAETESVEYALLLNNMAGTFRMMGHPEQAIEMFHQAADICRRNTTTDRSALVSILCNLSLVSQELEMLEEAIRYLEEALGLLRRIPDQPYKTAMVYHNLTILYHRLGCREESERYTELALNAVNACASKRDVHCAKAMSSLAGLLYSFGNYKRAAEVYQKAAEYTRRWFGENEEYANICQSMSWAYEALKEWGLARQALMNAERVFLQKFGAQHERTQTVRDMLRRLSGAAS